VAIRDLRFRPVLKCLTELLGLRIDLRAAARAAAAATTATTATSAAFGAAARRQRHGADHHEPTQNPQ
jgi:hypothetical protein